MKKNDIRDIEIDLLIEVVHKRYGLDFLNYSRASLERRIDTFIKKNHFKDISCIIPAIMHDESFFELFLYSLSITVSEMFRDPLVYKSIRQNVVDVLKTFPFVKVWHAGCAFGEEVYSMAILLQEEGLGNKTQTYATDISERIIRKAKEGIYPLDCMKKYTKNYMLSGGERSFSRYYHSKYESAIIRTTLRKNIVFAVHNLACESSFGQMHLIICRNVLIYFDKILQNKVLNLFYDSLVHNGFLCLGSKESLKFYELDHKFKCIDIKRKIYQKRG